MRIGLEFAGSCHCNKELILKEEDGSCKLIVLRLTVSHHPVVGLASDEGE